MFTDMRNFEFQHDGKKHNIVSSIISIGQDGKINFHIEVTCEVISEFYGVGDYIIYFGDDGLPRLNTQHSRDGLEWLNAKNQIELIPLLIKLETEYQNFYTKDLN